MAQTFIYRNTNYDYEEIKQTIGDLLDSLGAREIIHKNAKVFLKVNLLSKKQPEDCVTTHPTIARAVAEYVIAREAKPILGDSPGGPFTESALRGIYQATGMHEAALLSGAELNYDTTAVEVRLAEHRALERIEMVKAILDADIVIDLAKLKTHVMMTYTGAVKNLYGTIPGLTKAAYHMKLQEPQPFANHLIDICQKIKPSISIIDGVHAMEGDGPSNGVKREFGFIMGSRDPYELDYVACTMAGIQPSLVATHVEAIKRNILSPDRIRVLFDRKSFSIGEFQAEIKRMGLEPFQRPKPMSVNFLHGNVPKFLEEFLIKQTKSKPIFIEDKCIGCGKCVQSCPAQIIALKDRKAKPELKNCISCFCCHELCPVDAIKIHVPFLAKILFGEKSR